MTKIELLKIPIKKHQKYLIDKIKQKYLFLSTLVIFLST